MCSRLIAGAVIACGIWAAAPTATKAQQPVAPTVAAASPSPAIPVFTQPQRRRIILMRHGDVTYYDAQGKPVLDADKVTLSEKGKAQADAVGAYLKTIGVAKIDR